MWRPSFFCKLAIKVFFRSARAVAAAVGRTYADDTSNGRPAVSLSISLSLRHTNTQRLFHGVTSLMHQAKTDTVTHLPPFFCSWIARDEVQVRWSCKLSLQFSPFGLNTHTHRYAPLLSDVLCTLLLQNPGLHRLATCNKGEVIG